ncbi:MAG: TonB-dependent receptor [Burkholderiales bacterium]|nr:TonB-dependent receptor [Burkholderiales bacterium]
MQRGSRRRVDQGKTPLYTPKNAAALWLDYAFGKAPLAGLSVGAGVRYTGATWGDSANTLRVGSNTLVDAALRWDLARAAPGLKGFLVAVNASNLLDKE